jgi:hypothetical protein
MNVQKLPFRREDFVLHSLDDDLRVDTLCGDLLQRWFADLLESDLPPEEASALARSADYFLRDFVIDFRRGNILDEHPGFVRQFAATWYIVRNLEPNREELERHLAGVREFYRYAAQAGLVSPEFLAHVERECADIEYYSARIDSFWGITGDGYGSWERECPLKAGLQ